MRNRILAGLAICLLAQIAFAEVTVSTLTQEFSGSGGLVVDASGDIFVADFGQTLAGPPGSIVTRVDPVTGDLSIFANGFRTATGNAFDSKGNLFQSNALDSFVSKVDPQGNASFFTNEWLDTPVGIAIDSAGNVFVASCGSEHIRMVTPDGLTSIPFSINDRFDCPNGLAFDENDTLYMTNSNDGLVFSIDGDGNATVLTELPSSKGLICLEPGCSADAGGPGNGYLTYANGRLYVVARGVHQIYEVLLDGTTTLLAGTGERGNADGPADEATFSLPTGIDASPDGRFLYVNDSLARSELDVNPVVVRVIDLGPQEEQGFVVNPGISGSWFPGNAGEGWLLEILSLPTAKADGSKVNGVAVAYWFTFPPEGKGFDGKGASAEQAWIVGVGAVQGNTIAFEDAQITSGGVFGPGFDPSAVAYSTWGDFVMVFDDCGSGTLSYAAKGGGEFGSGELPMERLTSVDGLDCETLVKGLANVPSEKVTEIDSSISGSWYDPDHDGEGWLIEVLPGGLAVVYWFSYDGDGNQAWFVGVGTIDGKTITVDDVSIPQGTVFGADFDPDDVDLVPWGSMEFTFDSCDTGSMSYVSDKGGEFGSGSLDLERITGLAGLSCN